MDILRKYPGWIAAGAFILGLIIGLVVLGWWVWPVQWTDATPEQLAQDYQDQYVRMVAELYSFNGNAETVQQALGGWGGDVTACGLAAETADPSERARLEAVATVANGAGCAGLAQQTAAGEEGGGGNNLLLPALFLLLLLALIVAAIFYFLNRRNQAVTGDDAPELTYAPAPGAAPAAMGPVGQDIATVPVARFHTTYVRGNDGYDDSFSIENANAEFLGECGVGIAESIGTDSGRGVTALEIWLFDKSDIRTITKVVMSDHAFFDEALKAKLAPKGEPVLAREGETIVLETASLIINAEITEMEYAQDANLPNQSSFERVMMSLSAWAKEEGYRESSPGFEDEGDLEDLIDF